MLKIHTEPDEFFTCFIRVAVILAATCLIACKLTQFIITCFPVS